MNIREGRQCARTGLWLVDDFTTGLRVATRTRGPLDPPVRLSGEDPGEWNRFDTPGSTIYLADSEEIAFAEMLSTYALKLGQKHPLQKDADFLGMGLEEFYCPVRPGMGRAPDPTPGLSAPALEGPPPAVRGGTGRIQMADRPGNTGKHPSRHSRHRRKPEPGPRPGTSHPGNTAR